MVSLRQAVARNSPPDCFIEWFEPRLTQIQVKRKKSPIGDFFLFMERVTRLELATSTLARWRSTG